MSKKPQFRDDKGVWRDMVIVDFRLTPETVAFEAAKQQGLTTRVIDDSGGAIKVLNMYRMHKGRNKR